RSPEAGRAARAGCDVKLDRVDRTDARAFAACAIPLRLPLISNNRRFAAVSGLVLMSERNPTPERPINQALPLTGSEPGDPGRPSAKLAVSFKLSVSAVRRLCCTSDRNPFPISTHRLRTATRRR